MARNCVTSSMERSAGSSTRSVATPRGIAIPAPASNWPPTKLPGAGATGGSSSAPRATLGGGRGRCRVVSRRRVGGRLLGSGDRGRVDQALVPQHGQLVHAHGLLLPGNVLA